MHGALGGVGDVASAVINVASDPCLGEVAKLVNDLHEAEQAKPASGGGGRPGSPPTPPAAPVKGIGLCKAVPPLRVAVYVRKNPAVVIAGGLVVVLGLVGLGYVLGKEKR